MADTPPVGGGESFALCGVVPKCRKGAHAMDLIKAMGFGALISGCVALVIGTQGSSGGQLVIESFTVADVRLYWSWPIFLASTGLFWGLLLLQR